MEKDWKTIGKMGKLWEHMDNHIWETMGKYGNMMENTGKLWEIKETGAKW